MTAFEDLSDELISRILSFISPTGNYIYLYKVCKRWWMLMDALVGRLMVIGRPTPFMKSSITISDHYYGGIDKIDYYGVRTCHVGEVLDASDRVEGLTLLIVNAIKYFFGPSRPQFKYPNLLHQIQFHGSISPSCFESMMTATTNLKHMVIHWAALATLDFQAISKLQLPRLELLYVWGTNPLISPLDNEKELFASKNFNGISLFNNLKNFLRRVYFPKLRNVTLEVPFSSYNEESVTEATLEFLNRHSETLWSLKYSINCDLSRNIDKAKLANHLKEKLTECFDHTATKLINLRSLELTTLINGEIEHFSFWTNVIGVQNSLMTLCAEGTKITHSFLKQILSQNSHSLNQLRVANLNLDAKDDNPRVLRPIDCEIFRSCNSLRTLSLEGTNLQFARSAHHYYLRSQFGGLIKSSFLPETLNSLHIKHIALDSSEVATICLKLLSIKRLWLMDVGCSGTLGMTYNIMVRIMESNKRFDLLYISGGINGALADTLRQYTWCLNRPPYVSQDDMKILNALANVDPIILELNKLRL